MNKIGNISKFRELNDEVKTRVAGGNIIGLFKYLRAKYISENQSYHLRKALEKLDTITPTVDSLPKNTLMKFAEIQHQNNLEWAKMDFHLHYRVTNPSDLLELIPDIEDRKNYIEKVIKRGFLFSILPINLLLPKEVLENFLPPSDYFEPHQTKYIDPYGIFTKKSKVIDSKTGLLLGSRKFKHSFLMNIHGLCPIGCSDCYKAYYTREEHKLGVTLNTLPMQTQAVVDWMNKNPEIYDVIVSGGEPLLANNSAIANMLKIFENAINLKTLRICTGTLFLGLPVRIDDNLLNLLKDFSARTGVIIRIHANLYNHFQFTPEAIIAIHRIRARGFNIYSQVPIKEGVNFFSHDEEKTLNFLHKLNSAQILSGVEPYKYIVDMHPRTNMYYVPIEPLLRIWSILSESHDFPETERPKTLSVLFRQGNIILSGHSLFAAQKEIDKANDLVRYYIPATFNRKKIFVYEEPLLDSNGDPKSLERLRKNWFKLIEKTRKKLKKEKGDGSIFL